LSAAAPHFNVDVEVKSLPLMVSVNAVPPATTELGLRLVMVAAAEAAREMVNDRVMGTTAVHHRNNEFEANMETPLQGARLSCLCQNEPGRSEPVEIC
jgi:hypothetical protein